jgi:hypothetical protein
MSLSFFQERSQIEVYWRPLSQSASALVFLSRRQDMPYRYHTSLAKLNYTAGSYEVCSSFLVPFLVLSNHFVAHDDSISSSV